MRGFNQVYYSKQLRSCIQKTMHYTSFFHPLDAVGNWNRIYGKGGFYQFQCVVPRTERDRNLHQILQTVADSGQGSFLAVLKEFGALHSPGLLSFPRPGMTLAMDIPNRGSATQKLLARLDDMVAEAGGAVYPAKDATMSSVHFKQYFPRWPELEALRDRRISSSFWRRVSGD